MALDNNDLLAVQKAGGGTNSVRKALISDLVNFVSVSVSTIWKRDGTDISPPADGDNLIGVGEIQAASAAFTGTVTGGDATFDHLEATDIDGGAQELSPGEIDYPDP